LTPSRSCSEALTGTRRGKNATVLWSSAYASLYGFQQNIIKARSASNPSSRLHPVLSYHLAHSCPPMYGYSPTNIFQNPTRHLLFSGKLPHARQTDHAQASLETSCPRRVLFRQSRSLGCGFSLISYGTVRQNRVSMTDVTSQECVSLQNHLSFGRSATSTAVDLDSGQQIPSTQARVCCGYIPSPRTM